MSFRSVLAALRPVPTSPQSRAAGRRAGIRPRRPSLAVETREGGQAPQRPSKEWLDAIHALLSPRLPVGQRLEVMPPRYVDVRITATLMAVPHVRIEDVRARVEKALRARLAIVAPAPDADEWPLGRDLTRLMVLGWLRLVEGVAGVKTIDLFADGISRTTVSLGPIDLPRLQISAGDIVVERPPLGGGR